VPLADFVSGIRLQIFEELRKGRPPSQGSFDEKVFREASAKGEPQIGTTRFEPHAILLEFVYPDTRSSNSVLAVRIESPERIVFLPVPAWVQETIWQGDVDGSYHFESEARSLLSEFESELSEDENKKWFKARPPRRRE